PEGRVFLIDRGVVQYHAQVQGDLDEALYGVFKDFALLESLSETTGFTVVEGERITADQPCADAGRRVRGRRRPYR
ncbi:MAG: hypothetical protein O7D32_00580, partial [bacterium]|nr:hypothetical protein [bacterium]